MTYFSLKETLNSLWDQVQVYIVVLDCLYTVSFHTTLHHTFFFIHFLVSQL